MRFKQKGADFSNARQVQLGFGGFAGVFAHLLRAARERQRLCQLLNILVECRITANSNGQSMASRVPSRGLTARGGTGAGTFLGIVAVGSDFRSDGIGVIPQLR